MLQYVAKLHIYVTLILKSLLWGKKLTNVICSKIFIHFTSYRDPQILFHLLRIISVMRPANVVYVDDPYYNRRRYDSSDVALGVVAGAAVGSMMWGPLLWW